MAVTLAVERLTKTFGGGRTLIGRRRPAARAVSAVSLAVQAGECLGVVGESGCGKTTLARMLVGLEAPTAGAIEIAGKPVRGRSTAERRALARQIQYVFQDPAASLNPRKTVRRALETPLRRLLKLRRREQSNRLADLMGAVGLPSDLLERYPHELSGGQAQRIGIARALAADARIVVLDEPVSALDVSVQAQVLTLLADLRADYGLTYVFISHDLSVIESICDRVAVMYFGRVVEIGSTEALFARPRHPYTALLLNSAPVPGRRRVPPPGSAGELPDPFHPPPGCAFAARCPNAGDRCRREQPELTDMPDAQVACWHPLGPTE